MRARRVVVAAATAQLPALHVPHGEAVRLRHTALSSMGSRLAGWPPYSTVVQVA